MLGGISRAKETPCRNSPALIVKIIRYKGEVRAQCENGVSAELGAKDSRLETYDLWSWPVTLQLRHVEQSVKFVVEVRA